MLFFRRPREPEREKVCVWARERERERELGVVLKVSKVSLMFLEETEFQTQRAPQVFDKGRCGPGHHNPDHKSLTSFF